MGSHMVVTITGTVASRKQLELHHVHGEPGHGAAHPHHEQDAGRVHPAGCVQQHRPSTDSRGWWPVCREIISAGEFCWKRFPTPRFWHCDQEASYSAADQWTYRVWGVPACQGAEVYELPLHHEGDRG